MPSFSKSFLQGVGPGLSQGIAAYAGSDRAGRDAYDRELLTRSRISKALADLEDTRRVSEFSSPTAVRNRALLESGIPLDSGDQVDEFLRTGGVGAWRPGTAAELKGAPTAPAWFDPKKMGPLASRIAAAQAVQAGEAKGAKDYYEGQHQLYETGLTRDVVNGVIPADQLTRGMSVLKAAPAFKIPEGYTGNQFTGDIDVKDPVNALRQDYGRAQEQERRAAAAENLAQAASARASAAKSRAEIGQNQGFGKAPQGYVWGPADPATGQPTMLAVRGGPADLKQQGALNQDTASLTNAVSSFDRLGLAANTLLKHPGLSGVTGWQGAMPNFPGSKAADAEALLGTLKSQIGFSVLQEMRNASKTGGALGAVSDAEGKRLESNLAALDNAQSIEQFEQSLRDIVQYTEDAKDRLRQAYNLKHANQAPASGAPKVVRTGRDATGRKVNQFSDGSIRYAD